MFINSANIEHPPFMYIYVLTAHTSFSVRLSENLSDEFKNIQKKLLQSRRFLSIREEKGITQVILMSGSCGEQLEGRNYRKQEKAIWAGL